MIMSASGVTATAIMLTHSSNNPASLIKDSSQAEHSDDYMMHNKNVTCSEGPMHTQYRLRDQVDQMKWAVNTFASWFLLGLAWLLLAWLCLTLIGNYNHGEEKIM